MNHLSNMKKDQPFKVPEDYFENLGDRIQERIEAEENPKNKNLLRLVLPYLWMAASIIGVVLLAKIILTNSVPDDYKSYKITQETTAVDSQINSTKAEGLNWTFDDMTEATSDEIIEYLSDYDLETETLLANL